MKTEVCFMILPGIKEGTSSQKHRQNLSAHHIRTFVTLRSNVQYKKQGSQMQPPATEQSVMGETEQCVQPGQTCC